MSYAICCVATIETEFVAATKNLTLHANSLLALCTSFLPSLKILPESNKINFYESTVSQNSNIL